MNIPVIVVNIMMKLDATILLAKSNGRFIGFYFWKLSSRRNVFNFGDKIIGNEYNISIKQKWCQMFNPMPIAFRMWQNIICQNQVCSERLIGFIKIFGIFVKISTPRHWHLFLPCFMVIEPVFTKPWPVNCNRLWLLTGSISSTQPR